MSVPLGYLSYTEYDYTEINRIRLQKEGLWTTFFLIPVGKNSFVSFNDYAPKVFAYIRQFYGIDNEEYKHAVTHYIQENIQKSGAFIYYSHDYRYVVKTIKKSDKEKFLYFFVIIHHSIDRFYRSFWTIWLKTNTRSSPKSMAYIASNCIEIWLAWLCRYSEEIYLLVMNNFLFYKSRGTFFLSFLFLDGYRLVPEKYDLKVYH